MFVCHVVSPGVLMVFDLGLVMAIAETG